MLAFLLTNLHKNSYKFWCYLVGIKSPTIQFPILYHWNSTPPIHETKPYHKGMNKIKLLLEMHTHYMPQMRIFTSHLQAPLVRSNLKLEIWCPKFLNPTTIKKIDIINRHYKEMLQGTSYNSKRVVTKEVENGGESDDITHPTQLNY